MAASVKKTSAVQAGTLYVVATPIGNLEDITLRALRILQEVDLIAAEDTRHTRKLLSHFDIHTPLISYYKEKEVAKATEVVSALAAGSSVALVSDAGTPGVSDPGSVLVSRAREEGLGVVPIPGASALTTAMSIAGQREKEFLFVGFLPAKPAERKKVLKSLKSEPYSLVFYEAPRRVKASLADCLQVLGNRGVFIGRELTKLHEECLRGSLSEVVANLKERKEIRGEFVVLIEGQAQEDSPQGEDVHELLTWYRDQSELSMKDAVKKLAKDLGLSRSKVYQEALKIWQK